MHKFCTALAISLFFITAVKAQNPLPDFSVEDMGSNRIRISWVNPYNEGCIQLNVQRSYDSLKNYTTLFSTTSPELPENGFVDNSYYGGRVYYRIFYVLGGGSYYFTKAKRSGSKYANQPLQLGTDSALLITIFSHKVMRTFWTEFIHKNKIWQIWKIMN